VRLWQLGLLTETAVAKLRVVVRAKVSLIIYGHGC